MCADACVGVGGDQRLTPAAFPKPLYLMNQNPSLNLELTTLAALVGVAEGLPVSASQTVV